MGVVVGTEATREKIKTHDFYYIEELAQVYMLRVSLYAARWGVTVVDRHPSHLPEFKANGWSMGPAGGACSPATRTVSCSGLGYWAPLLHEVSHLVATPDSLNGVDEPETMLAFERLSVDVLKLPIKGWDLWMSNYTLNGPWGGYTTGGYWQDGTALERWNLLYEGRRRLQEAGIIDGRWRPTYTRTPDWQWLFKERGNGRR